MYAICYIIPLVKYIIQTKHASGHGMYNEPHTHTQHPYNNYIENKNSNNKKNKKIKLYRNKWKNHTRASFKLQINKYKQNTIKTKIMNIEQIDRNLLSHKIFCIIYRPGIRQFRQIFYEMNIKYHWFIDRDTYITFYTHRFLFDHSAYKCLRLDVQICIIVCKYI